MKRLSKVRSNRGILFPIIFGCAILACFAFGSLGGDFAHMISVKQELQTAADAGALAGVKELAVNSPSSTNIQNAQNYAATVAAANSADGKSVSSSTSGTTVSVSVSSNTNPRTVTVQTSRRSQNIFACMFGNNSTSVAETATAGVTGMQTLYANQAQPLAISLDTVPSNGPQRNTPLSSYPLNNGANGNNFTIVLDPTNSANSFWLGNWTSTNNPNLTFGVSVVSSAGTVASNLNGISVGDLMVLPVVVGGAPPFSGNRTVVGAIAFRVTSINWPHQISGTLEPYDLAKGAGGPSQVSNVTQQQASFLNAYNPWVYTIIR